MRAVCAPKCLEKDAHADFLCLHCYPNAVGDNTWAYVFLFCFVLFVCLFVFFSFVLCCFVLFCLFITHGVSYVHQRKMENIEYEEVPPQQEVPPQLHTVPVFLWNDRPTLIASHMHVHLACALPLNCMDT